MSKESKTPPKRVRINYTYPESIETKIVNHFVIQNDEDSFILSFFEVRQPLILGDTEEERAEQLNELEKVDAKCIARLVMTPSRMYQFIGAVKDNFEKFESRMALINDSENEESE